MSDLRNEPSMEDILASIKRIIAEDNAAAVGGPRGRPASLRAVPAEPEASAQAEPESMADEPEEEVLELTEPAPEDKPELVSDNAASASRQSLSTLSKMLVRGDPAQDNTLEGLVRELLRPMLKDWLDAHLPGLVESLVAREISRITGKAL